MCVLWLSRVLYSWLCVCCGYLEYYIAGYVCAADGIRTTIPVGEECVININTMEAGYGNVTCRIHSNTGSDVDIDIVDNGDGTVSVMYTPRVPGAYTLNLKFGGQPIPNGVITQQVLFLWLLLCVTVEKNMCSLFPLT